MPTYLETARNKLRALKGSNLVSDIDAGFQALAEDVDVKMVSFWSGTAAGRPAAGQINRIYHATDTDVYYFDTGVTWRPILTVPTAPTERATVPIGSPITPSATHTTFVALQIYTPNLAPTIEAKVYVGGVEIYQSALTVAETRAWAFAFYVPPNTSYEIKTTIGGFGASASYSFVG